MGIKGRQRRGEVGAHIGGSGERSRWLQEQMPLKRD